MWEMGVTDVQYMVIFEKRDISPGCQNTRMEINPEDSLLQLPYVSYQKNLWNIPILRFVKLVL